MMQNAQVPQAVVYFDTPAYADPRFASRIRQCREAEKLVRDVMARLWVVPCSEVFPKFGIVVGLRAPAIRILGSILGALLLTSVVAAEEVRQTEFANELLGSWAPTNATCQANDETKITISEILYHGPDRTCGVLWIVEIPAVHATNYSVHGLCVDASQSSEAGISDLVIQAKTKDKIMVGRSLADLKAYYRCPTT
jgi:hypothetical protein